MPYRPLTVEETQVIKGMIETMKKRISILQEYIDRLEARLGQGQWYMDNEQLKECCIWAEQVALEDNEQH